MSVTSHKQPWELMPHSQKSPPPPRYVHGQISRHKQTHTPHTGQRRT